ncbi:hypothetical protein [Pollutibacter soli]|uniref:hypothetical protein n=1 Tax=Pollutibacter soli TaxID=3034157 RepID=UPI00301359DC
MTRLVVLFLILTGCHSSPAQSPKKISVNHNDPASGYYLVIKPATDKIKGVLVLLDGFNGNPESVLQETKLPVTAAANGYLTIVAAMGPKMYADSTVVSKLNLLMDDVKKRFKVNADQFLIGGFSAGGTIALRYAELAKEMPEKTTVYPKAVFAVDSPVDIFSIYHFFEEQIRKNYSDPAVQEAIFVSQLMKQEHGVPDSNRSTYLQLTPFYEKMEGLGNEKFLKDTPVRLYHDVDINWRLKERLQSGYDANLLNASEMILRLMVLKNKKAEFVSGRKGYRSNGTRHPHSWNIVDEVEFVEWMKSVFKS